MRNPLVSPDFQDRIDTDGTYLHDCFNIGICSKRDIRNHGCLKGSTYRRCSLEEKQQRFDKANSEKRNK